MTGANDDKKANVVALADPKESRHGGTMRTREQVHHLRSLGYEVEIFAPPPLNHRENQSLLHRAKRHYLPMPTAFGAKDQDLTQRLSDRPADLTVVSVLAQYQYFRDNRSRLWLDFMDIWSEVARREASHRRGFASATAVGQANILRRAELRAAKSASLVTCAGWSDTELLLNRGVDAKWIPTTLPEDEFYSVRRADGPPSVGFLGNFRYWPNRDAFSYLVKSWLPTITTLGYRLVVAGHGANELPTGNNRSVLNLGEVQNLDDFYAIVDCTIAPIRLGGGIKVKVVESLAKGVPVIGTPFAFDGLSPQSRKLVREVADTSELLQELAGLERVDPDAQELNPYRRDFATRALRAVASL